MDKDIKEIFERHGTDKLIHGYAEFYKAHLPKTATKILEIGVKEGRSIKVWKEIYPDAHIFGLDLFEEYPEPFHEDWVTWFKGNQADSKLLDTVRLFGEYDIIIDDGSHRSRHQLMTFYGLVGAAKLYVVEDLHCCKEEFWRDGMQYKHTMLGMLNTAKEVSLLGKGEWRGAYFNFPFEIYDDKIAFIYNYAT